MHDINFIRNNPNDFDKSLKLRNIKPNSSLILNLDKSKRDLLTTSQELRSTRKSLSSDFSKSNEEDKKKTSK
tara:strand:- start:195 stop:410 length:216 start_codon:yes stop_codon:yes gene_type:complete